MVNQNLKKKQVHAVFMSVVCMAVCVAGCSTVSQGDTAGEILDRELAARVVHLQGNEGPGKLNRLVQPGTVVVWLNKSAQDVRIVFPERKVTIACLNPVSFNVNAEGIYDSKVLSPGAVASLCFIQPGLYAYTVEQLTGDRSGNVDAFRMEGTIVVK